MRVFVDISYEGTHYHGWQIQQNAITVQGVVTEKLSTILGKQVDIVGSGRTDAGVHAKQQIFHVDLEKENDLDLIKHKMNSFLPYDISINEIRKVKAEAHARFDAQLRSYRYNIIHQKDPFLYKFAYHMPKKLDLDRMNQAAELLIGEKDFTSFSRVKTEVNHFVCNIVKAEWVSLKDRIEFRISADRFLRGMVRAIVGTMNDVGLGVRDPEDIVEIIEMKNRKAAGSAAPAKGLFLTEVRYPDSVYS